MRVDGFAQVASINVARYPQSAGTLDPAPVEQLLITMGVAGVDGAVLVQPDQYGPDHSYLLDALDAYGSRLRAVCAAGSVEIEAELVIGARFSPAQFRADPAAVARVVDLCKLLYLPHPVDLTRFAKARAVLEVEQGQLTEDRADSLAAFCSAPDRWVLIKASSLPSADFSAALNRLSAAAGRARLLWGSGFPACGGSNGYSSAIAPLVELGLPGDLFSVGPAQAQQE